MSKLLTKQFTHNKMKIKKTALGPIEVQFFAYVQMRKKVLVRTDELTDVLGINPKQERELLSRMSRAGLIIRLKRGVYLVPPRVPPGGRYGVDEYLILEKLMEVLKGRYQISVPNALNYYGFSEQIPNRMYVYNNRIYGDRRIGGRQFSFIKTDNSRLGDTISLETGTGSKGMMASKARTLLDAVYDWSRFNTLPKAYQWIVEEVKKDKTFAKDLVKMAVKYGNQGTRRRLGYLLEYLGTSRDTVNRIRRELRASKSLFLWIPNRSGTGPVNKDWGLVINAEPEFLSDLRP
jgi:predicted transcriptional regulator of viral defense system